MTPLILFLGPDEMTRWVEDQLPGFSVTRAATETEVDSLLPGVACILDASMRIRFPALRLALAPLLRAYVTATTGADHVDAEALANRGIPLLTLKGQTGILKDVTAAAEHSWLLLMACARGLRGAVEAVSKGAWDRTRHPGTMLKGRVLGIVGCGRIGQWMARYAKAFGMRCLGSDPFVDPWPEGIERVELGTLFKIADFISIHVTLGPGTTGLISRELLNVMKPGGVLINTSRGEVLDEVALLEGLESGRIGGAGLDVLTGEPEVERHPLRLYSIRRSNLLITPHIGGFSPDAVRHVLRFSCERIVALFGAPGHVGT